MDVPTHQNNFLFYRLITEVMKYSLKHKFTLLLNMEKDFHYWKDVLINIYKTTAHQLAW